MLAQIKKLALSLSPLQRALVAAAAIAALGAMWWLNQWNRERVFQPLFTGLAAEDAGAVVAKLKEGGVEFRLSAGGNTVLVPSDRIAELRIQLASAGIPKAGRIGFELFDKNNFGITDFAEQVNYRRALEGELERSVLALDGVESARVHITPAKESVFTESKEPAKASVLLTLKKGARILPANVDAISHLMSSAVQGLDPERVSVVDGAGKLLPGTGRQGAPQEESEAADKALLYRQRIERDLLEKVNATLEPILGAKRFRAGVSVECDFSSGELSEETFDPAKAVVSTSQKSDESGGAQLIGGQPGTPSNLPRPAPRLSAQAVPASRKTESVTYQNSRLVRKTKLPQGAIKRLSVSVLLDNYLRWEVENGKPKRVMNPPAPEQMKSIRDLVSGAAGVDLKRGDSLVVESIAFGSTLEAGPPPGLIPAPAPAKAPAAKAPAPDGFMGIPKSNLMVMGGVAGAAALALLGGLAWMIRKRKRKAIAVEAGAELAEGAGAKEGGKQLAAGAKAAVERKAGAAGEAAAMSEEEAAEDAELRAMQEEKQVLGSIKLPETKSKKATVLTKHIAEEAKRSPEAIAQIVRTWLNEEKEN